MITCFELDKWLTHIVLRSAPSFIQKIDSLSWNNYMEECLEVVDKTYECENDAVLVALVKLQLIAETATQSQRLGDHDPMTGSFSISGRAIDEKATMMLVKILQARVHSLLESLSPEVKSHRTFLNLARTITTGC